MFVCLCDGLCGLVYTASLDVTVCTSVPMILMVPVGPWLTVCLHVTACVTVVKVSQSTQPQALPSSPPFRFSIFLNHDKAWSPLQTGREVSRSGFLRKPWPDVSQHSWLTSDGGRVLRDQGEGWTGDVGRSVGRGAAGLVVGGEEDAWVFSTIWNVDCWGEGNPV